MAVNVLQYVCVFVTVLYVALCMCICDFVCGVCVLSDCTACDCKFLLNECDFPICLIAQDKFRTCVNKSISYLILYSFIAATSGFFTETCAKVKQIPALYF